MACCVRIEKLLVYHKGPYICLLELQKGTLDSNFEHVNATPSAGLLPANCDERL